MIYKLLCQVIISQIDICITYVCRCLAVAKRMSNCSQAKLVWEAFHGLYGKLVILDASVFTFQGRKDHAERK